MENSEVPTYPIWWRRSSLTHLEEMGSFFSWESCRASVACAAMRCPGEPVPRWLDQPLVVMGAGGGP